MSRNYSFIILIISLFFYSNIVAQSEKRILSKIEELKSKPDFNPEIPAYIDLLIDLATAYNYSKPDSTTVILKESHRLSIKSKYKKGEVKTLYVYGEYFSVRGEKEKAHEYNLKALMIANKFNFKTEKIIVLNNMGINSWSQGNNANALTYYREGLDIAEEIEDAFMMSIFNDNIALLYSDNGDFETALTFHEKSRQISLREKDEKALGRALLNMAIIYLEKEDFISAESMVDECLQLFEKENSIDWLSHTYEVKGTIALENKNYQEALEWFIKSKKLLDEIDYVLGYAKTYCGLAESYLGLRNFKLAEEYALKALKISKELDVIEDTKYTNSVLAMIYHENGQNKKAFEYQSDYIELYKKESSEAYKKGLGVLRSEIKFENQKKLLIEENNKALAQQKRYVYIAIAALLLVTLFLGMIYRTNKLQKKFTSQLSDSNKTKDKLFSVIAHDLRGPINSFYSLMKLYLDKEISKEESDYLLPKALQDIQSISEMLNNLLVWARTQMEGAVIKPQKTDINKIIIDNVSLLNPLAEKKSIKINNTVAENTFSFCDKDHIDIVIRNLMSNAIKFTNINGEISISAIEKNNELQIEVKDNGVGMDLETQTKLFDKNNNKSTYGTSNEKGTGLGLSLSKEMVESNGGKIWVKSIKNEGTTIYFTVPNKAPSIVDYKDVS